MDRTPELVTIMLTLSPFIDPVIRSPSVPVPEIAPSLVCTSAHVDCEPLLSEYDQVPDASLLAEAVSPMYSQLQKSIPMHAPATMLKIVRRPLPLQQDMDLLVMDQCALGRLNGSPMCFIIVRTD